MSLRNELNIVPPKARMLAVVLGVGTAILLPAIMRLDANRPPLPVLILGGPVAGLVAATYVLLIGYLYGDARRRGMRHVMWTLLAIFIPNAIGIILYFLLRDPLLRPCRNCGTELRNDWDFCPVCATPVGRTCPSCRRKVDPLWVNCAHCGATLSGQEPIPRAAR